MTRVPSLTLADFLLARIAEDEAAARDCAKVYPGDWDLYDRGHSAKVQADEPSFRIVVEYADQDEAMEQGLAWLGDALAHIQRNSPARVLAECEAKRKIIEWHKAWPVLVEVPPSLDQADGEGYDYARSDLTSLTLRMSQRMAWLTEKEYVARFGTDAPTGPILQLLALPYADHPEYREEWRP